MRWLALSLLLLAAPAAALDCGPATHLGSAFTVCRADAAHDDLRLFLNDPETGAKLGSFTNVDAALAREGLKLAFAMNGGMYHPDRRPVGHYVEHGVEFVPAIGADGPGNFGLLPNGVFCIGARQARVIETRRFLREAPGCRFATQSGPMLVIDGALHPRFLTNSDSRYVRNGVGTSDDGRTVWFAISAAPVNFHRFATLFRDVLGAPQALYLDGNISRLYAPAIGRHDGGLPMGPIVGVVVPRGE